MQSPLSILQHYWQHTAFRGEQEAIIQSVLDGNDTLALLPTGGGKSLCFQIPALLKEGLCIVITPLIALMKDQVQNLTKKGIPAIYIHSGMTQYEVRKTLLDAVYSDCKFLYLSPERLETALFNEYLHALTINLIAVDEAHCISQWGYDFRPSYLRIAQLRNNMDYDVPMLALTASATSLVQDDMLDKLHFEGRHIFQQSFERPNLSYSVFKCDSKINKLIEILHKVEGSSIVYCKTRKRTKEVAQLLSYQNISADCYHAGLLQNERNEKQQQWMNNNTRVMVCTNAFGMGIDKPDVRTVIHFDTPDCLENYYQEAGRGGRDGKRAFAVLLYHSKDIDELKALPAARFPSIVQIKEVYQHLSDFLQIPVGSGEDLYFDFDMKTFITNFHLDSSLVMYVLKALESEGYIAFHENIFLPSKVCFCTDKFLIDEFERSHPALEPIIKCLLRTYPDIFDNAVSVFEKQLAQVMKIHDDAVKEQLHQLRAFGIIEYKPQKETPQIHFLHNRAPAKYLNINNEAYLQRRDQCLQRVQKMLDYTTGEHQCRSRFLAFYFGDENANNCGVCDNCLHQKSLHISEEEFAIITQHLLQHIPQNGIAINHLKLVSQNIHKNKFWKVLNYLQQERKVKSVDGIIHLV